MLLKSRDRGRSRILGRIKEREITFEDKIVFVIFIVRGFRTQIAIGECQDAKAIGRQLVVLLLEIPDQELVHRVNFSLQLESSAAAEDRLRSAFADQPMLTWQYGDHDGH